MKALDMAQPEPKIGFDRQHDLRSIDALRGYAIFLVICMHTFAYVPDLVWPVKRLMGLGYSGVQLFFIASAVTLMMSWNRDTSSADGSRVQRFFTNRFFRIAPLYFLAIVFYWFFDGLAPADFRLDRLLATLFFVNAWSPDLLPTTGGWRPVPGGWSISVEFMFYMVFPLLALTLTTMRRALGFVLAAYVLMLVAAKTGPVLYADVGAEAREHFLFFWPPNQVVVFALGVLVYRCIKSDAVRAWVARSPLDATGATAVFLVGFLAAQFYDPAHFPRAVFWLPQHLALTLLFAGWALFMILRTTKVAASNLIVNIGKMSFSIYLLHFAVLAALNPLLAKVWPLGRAGVASVPYVALLLVLATAVSYQLARITHRLVEKPAIRFGKSLSARVGTTAHVDHAPAPVVNPPASS